MKKFKLVLSILMLYLMSTMQFQTSAQSFCGWNSAYDSQLQDPEYIEYIQDMLVATEAAVQRISGETELMTVEIPIVFHIVHEGTSVPNGDNILYQDVEDAFNRLNADFSGTGISFCLAQRDDLGTPINDNDDPSDPEVKPGVVRVNASVFPEYMSSGISIGSQLEYDVKTLGRQFSNYSYLNVWVVRDLLGANSNGQVQGVGYFPNTVAPEVDGVMMSHSIFNNSSNRVLTHEVGHYLGLFHTFQGDDLDNDGIAEICPSATEPFPASDNINDTQPHKRSASGSCLSGDNLCSMDIDNSEQNSVYDQLEDITDNHMDYSREDCRNNFTEDQKMQMLGSIDCHRKGLTHSLGCQDICTPIQTGIPTFLVEPVNPIAESNEATIFSFLPGFSYVWFVNGEQQTYEDEDLQYTFDSPGQYTVCIQVYLELKDCTIQHCQSVYVVSNEVCYDQELDPCELLLNGDFSQFIPKFELPNIPPPFGMGDVSGGSASQPEAYDILCNWFNFRGTPGLIQLSNGEIALSIQESPIAPINQDGIKTFFESDLVIGNYYSLEFEYKVAGASSGSIQNGDNLESLLFGFSPSIEDDSYDELFTIDNISIENNFNLSFSDGGYIKVSHPFVMQSNNKHLLIRSINNLDYTTVVLIKNISIKACDFCTADPFFEWDEEICGNGTFSGRDRSGSNTGVTSWSINGITVPASVGQNDFDFNFGMSGTYDVCMNISCANGITNQYCEVITIAGLFVDPDTGEQVACDYCTDPSNIYDVSANRCGTTSNEFLIENFTFSVYKGYRPCLGDDFLINSGNGQVFTNDYVVDTSDPNYDFITVSFTILADDINAPLSGNFTICGPNGNTQCVKFNVTNSETCVSCTSDAIVTSLVVNCNDPDPTDMLYSYRGSFDIELPIGPDYIACGFSSSSSGLNVSNVQELSDNTFSIDFSVLTNFAGSFNSSINLCFLDDDGERICFDIDISVVNPCTPDVNGCEESISPVTLACDRTDGDNAVYLFPFAVGLPNLIAEGFEFCDLDGVSNEFISDDEPIGLYGQPLITTVGVGSYLFGIELTVPCDRVRNGGMTTLILNLCNPDGRELCVEIPLILECSDCDGGNLGGKLGGRSSSDNNDFLVYPNPASSSLIIKTEFSDWKKSYSIYSSAGKQLKKGLLLNGENRLDISEIPNGLYFLKFTNGEYKENRKIVILH